MKHILLFLGFLFITIALFAGFVKVCKNVVWDIRHREYKSLVINAAILILGILFYFYVFEPLEIIKDF